MPSTFSPALRLELIGNGEQAANWGNTTNTNLGTLLEQAISGVSSVAFPSDANYTLLSGNGVSDEARNAVLVMTGAITATRDVVVPTSNKFYAVRNATTGNQSILVRTAAGTGVTLANGFTQLMYCDGTNVVLASVPINSTNGNVVVGGDLAVTGNISVGGSGLFPPGVILEFGGISAPTGFLMCDGAAVNRTTFASLFASIGTAYGAGDGSTTFNVPNRVNRVGVGAGGLYARGSTGGAATETTSSAGAHNHTGATGSHAITEAQMPSHQHAGTTDVAGSHQHQQGSESLFNDFGGGSFVSSRVYSPGAFDNIRGQNTSTAGDHSHSITTDFRGSNQGHTHTISTDGNHDHTVSTISPYVASNYIIKT